MKKFLSLSLLLSLSILISACGKNTPQLSSPSEKIKNQKVEQSEEKTTPENNINSKETSVNTNDTETNETPKSTEAKQTNDEVKSDSTNSEENNTIGETSNKGFQLVEYNADALSAALGKQPVAIHFSADWCPKCKALDKKLEEFADTLPQNAIVFLADYDKETELKKEYQINQQTTVVFFNTQGEKIDTINNPSLDKVKELLSA